MSIELSDAALDAIADRVVAKIAAAKTQAVTVPATMTCEEFAERIGRGKRWVQDRCRIRKIKTVAGRRPYRIPASELARALA